MAVMATLLGIVITLGGVIYNPASEWLLTAPGSVAKLQAKLQQLREPLETIDAATDDLAQQARPHPPIKSSRSKSSSPSCSTRPQG